jgi:hypothetical protein
MTKDLKRPGHKLCLFRAVLSQGDYFIKLPSSEAFGHGVHSRPTGDLTLLSIPLPRRLVSAVASREAINIYTKTVVTTREDGTSLAYPGLFYDFSKSARTFLASFRSSM